MILLAVAVLPYAFNTYLNPLISMGLSMPTSIWDQEMSPNYEVRLR